MTNTTTPFAHILLASLMPAPSTSPPIAATTAATVLTYADKLEQDHRGAMLFVVATVCVYGLSIVFFIAGHLQKGLMNREEETQISSYLKRMHSTEPCVIEHNFHVTRFKSNMLASSAMGQRHNRRVSMVSSKQSVCYPPGLVMSKRTAMDLGVAQNNRVRFHDDDDVDHSLMSQRDNVQIVCEQPLFPKSSSSAAAAGGRFEPRRQRRSGLAGLDNQHPGDQSRGGAVACWRRAYSEDEAERPLVHTFGLPNIEEDELCEDSQLSSDNQREEDSDDGRPLSADQDLSDCSHTSFAERDLTGRPSTFEHGASSSSPSLDVMLTGLDRPAGDQLMDVVSLAFSDDRTPSSSYLETRL